MEDNQLEVICNCFCCCCSFVLKLKLRGNNQQGHDFLLLFPLAEHHNPRQVCLVKVFHSPGEHCDCCVHYSWSSVRFAYFETCISISKIS